MRFVAVLALVGLSAGTVQEDSYEPRSVRIRSTTGVPLELVEVERSGGSWTFRTLDDGRLWTRRGEELLRIRAPGHTERALDLREGTVVLEPQALLEVDADWKGCVDRVEPPRCYLDGEEVRATDVVTYGFSDGRFWAAVAREAVSELRVAVRFDEPGGYALIRYETDKRGGELRLECPDPPESAPLVVQVARPPRPDGKGAGAGGPVRARLTARPTDRSVETMPWGSVTHRGPSRVYEFTIGAGASRHEVSAVPVGRWYTIVAYDEQTGDAARRRFRFDGSEEALRLELEPGAVVRGRVLDADGSALDPSHVKLRVRVTGDSDYTGPETALDPSGRFRVVLSASKRRRLAAEPEAAVLVDVRARGAAPASFTVPYTEDREVDCGELKLPRPESQLVLRAPNDGGLLGDESIGALLAVEAVETIVFDVRPSARWEVADAVVLEGDLELYLTRHGTSRRERFLARSLDGRTTYADELPLAEEVRAILVQADINVGFLRSDDAGFVARRSAAYEVELRGDVLPPELSVVWRSMALDTQVEEVLEGVWRLRVVGPRKGLILRWKRGGRHLRPGYQRVEL